MRRSKVEDCLRVLDEHLNRYTDREQGLASEVTTLELSQIFKTHTVTVCNWRADGYIKESGRKGNSITYRLGHVREQLAKHLGVPAWLPPSPEPQPPQVIPPVQVIPPAQVVQHLHVHTSEEDFFERVRIKALSSAKEAYRDVILEAADQAKSKGDKDLAIRLYDDFIHMEQGLQVIYEKR